MERIVTINEIIIIIMVIFAACGPVSLYFGGNIRIIYTCVSVYRWVYHNDNKTTTTIVCTCNNNHIKMNANTVCSVYMAENE